jgi:signal transduction histidine kinase/DNA-binding NarL/FixJ family response regulator
MIRKRIIFFILTAFIAGTFVLVYIQYNSSKNISLLIDGNEKYLGEYKINNELKELEKDVVMIESNISNVISTNDSVYVKELGAKIAKVSTDLYHLQQVSDDEITVKEIDELDTAVKNKLNFSKTLLDSFYTRGKGSAEKLIGTLRGKRLMDSIHLIVQNVENSRNTLIERLTVSHINSGQKAQRFNTTLIVLILVGGAGLFWYIINIIQKLIQSEKQGKEAAQVKENFMANMSHEIRTPMNTVLGFTNLLQRKKLDEESAEYVRTIHKSGENLLNIINDILDLSKIEAGMMRIETAPFGIRGLVHSVEAMFKAKATEKQIELFSFIDESIPDTLEGDPTRLTQVLVNLVGNALKFTQKGRVTIKIINEGEINNVVRTGIIITDTGIGIAGEKLDTIFDRFKQAEDSVTRRYGGTGLGLSIAKDLILLQNGTIKVESEPGSGTSFQIIIPYKIAKGELPVGLLNEHNAVNKDGLANVSILVVEDNEINQSLIKHLFKSWKLLFEIVNNGREAIDILQTHPGKYRLVLMDIQMPEMDGYTATQKIRHELKLDIPIIAMTAHALAGEREKCLAYGMNEYISKPLRELQLHSLINQFTQKNAFPETPGKTPGKNGPHIYRYINLDYMREISGGNTAYEKTVTEQFIEAIPEDIVALENAWQNNDIDGIRQLAHNMKTTISVMGLNHALQPFLDVLEYQDLTEDSFRQTQLSINSICTASLAEAQHFYSTL